jgi:hypothetical protein
MPARVPRSWCRRASLRPGGNEPLTPRTSKSSNKRRSMPNTRSFRPRRNRFCRPRARHVHAVRRTHQNCMSLGNESALDRRSSNAAGAWRMFSAKNIRRSPSGSAFIEMKRCVNEMRIVGAVTLRRVQSHISAARNRHTTTAPASHTSRPAARTTRSRCMAPLGCFYSQVENPTEHEHKKGSAHRARGSYRCARRTHLLSHRILRAYLEIIGVLHLSWQHARWRGVGMMVQDEILSLQSDVATPRRVAACDTSQYLWARSLAACV